MCAPHRRAALAALLLLAPAVRAQEVYRWVDADGELHFTDDPGSIPKGAKAARTRGRPLSVVEHSPAPAAAPEAPPAPEAPAPRRRRQARPVAEGEPTVTLGPLPPEVRDGDAEVYQQALEAARENPRLARVGGLKQSVEIDFVASMEELARHRAPEWAVGFASSPTRVYLLSPYAGRASAYPRPWERIAQHEVAHAQQMQWALQFGSIPRWYAEGYAMWVAGDAALVSRNELAHAGVAKLQGRPLSDAFLQRDEVSARIAYSLALAGVELLLQRRGEGVLRALNERMAEGDSFAEAFAAAVGQSPAEFEAAFLESLRPDNLDRAE